MGPINLCAHNLAGDRDGAEGFARRRSTRSRQRSLKTLLPHMVMTLLLTRRPQCRCFQSRQKRPRSPLCRSILQPSLALCSRRHLVHHLPRVGPDAGRRRSRHRRHGLPTKDFPTHVVRHSELPLHKSTTTPTMNSIPRTTLTVRFTSHPRRPVMVAFQALAW